MRVLIALAMAIPMSTLVAAQTLPVPQAVSDPKQIASKPNGTVEKNLSIEKLFMTRQVGGADWSPDGKTVVFVSNISGRNNLWLVPAEGGWPTQLTVSDQRQTASGLVARWEVGSLTSRITTAMSSGTSLSSRPRRDKW